MTSHYITWWNVEHLFDKKDAPLERRPEKIKSKILADLSEWKLVVEQKLTKLTSVIFQINDNQSSHLLGLEVYELDEESVELKIFDGMVSGRYNEPVQFGQKSPHLAGYSDHLPISFILKEK